MKFFWYGILLFAVGYLVMTGVRPLVTPDEFRHAEIVREMQVSQDKFSPRLLGVRYFEKPLLGHYCNLASTRIFGMNPFGLRFPAAFFTLLTGGLIALVVWQRRQDAKLAALAFGFYMSFGLVYILGITPLADAPLCFFTTAATFFAFLAAVEETWSRRKAMLEILCGLALTGGFYAKGALGLAIPGISVAAFLIWDKRWKEFYRLPLLVLPAMLLTLLPIAWQIHRSEPDFWRYFIEIEHIQRFTREVSGQHPEPWWFFFPVLLIGALPGITFLPCFAGIQKEGRKILLTRPIYRMALSLLVFPFILLSCSSGKLFSYILPLYPALAILLAGGVMTYLRSSLDNRTFHATILFWSILLWTAGILAVLAAVFDTPRFTGGLPADVRQVLPALRILFAVAGCAGILFGSVLFVVRHRSRTLILSLFFTGLAVTAGVTAPFVSDRIDNGIMPEKSIAALLQSSGVKSADAEVIAAPSFGYSVAWKLQRADVRLFSSAGELDYGCAEARKRGEKDPVITRNEVQALIRKGERPVLFFTSPCKQQLQGVTPKQRLIDQNVQLDVF
ncbi:MAG: phospholipid carrier-dependent glycosyltransferase [Victivallaceae bacterium]|nr:phospholipid carrier-dependent glycosyltransferase [Victivallaceae bacterium]